MVWMSNMGCSRFIAVTALRMALERAAESMLLCRMCLPASVESLLARSMPQLQVHEPEKPIFVEQTPMTMGGPCDLTQTALPALEDSTLREVLGSMTGA